MEFVFLLILCGLILVVVGSVMGVIAGLRTGDLARRLDKAEDELRTLRRRVGVDDAPPATPVRSSASVAPDAEPVTPPSRPSAPARPAAPVEPIPRPDERAPELPAVSSPEPELPPAPAPVSEVAPAPRQPLPWLAPVPPPPPSPPVPPAPPPPPPVPPRPLPAEPPAAESERAVAADDRELVGLERAFGLRGLTWLGVGLLFLGIAFFLKYAYDRDWLGRVFGPRMRIGTAAVVAVALAVTGWRSLRNGLVGFGQGLLGGAQALAYLAIFAAFQPAVMVVDVPLLGPTWAFVLMAAVTAAGLVAAVRIDAIVMAFLAVLGGFATPLLVSSGQDSRDALCAYLLLLDVGVLFVAAKRRWRALDVLALAGTALLFGGWFWTFRHLHPQPDATIAWLAAFHVVFVVLPFVHHWRHCTVVPLERFVLALANVAWTFGWAAWTLRPVAPRLLAVMCFCGALLQLGAALVTARRVGDDVRTRDGFVALAILLLTLALFFLLPGAGTTTAWFAEAAVLAWLGYRFAHGPTRILATAVLAAAVIRVLAVHLPEVDRLAPLLWNPWCLQLMVAALGLAAFSAIHARFATGDGERVQSRAFGIAAGLWTLATMTLEILRHAAGHAEAWRAVAPASAIAWLQIAGALVFFAWGLRRAIRAVFLAGFLPLLAAAIAVGVAYDRYPADAWPVWNGCCLAGVGAVLVLVHAGRQARRLGDATLAAALHGMAQLAVTALATVETAAFLQRGGAVPEPVSVARALGWVWLGTSVGGALAASAWTSARMLALAAVPLALAVCAGFWQYGVPLRPHRLIGNQRFVFAVVTSAVVAAMRPMILRIRTAHAADPVAALALAAMLAFAGCESFVWATDRFDGAAAVGQVAWLLGATAVGGAAGGWWRARATANRALRIVASVALVAAVGFPLLVYATKFEVDWMFVNRRAGLVVAAVATVLLWSRDAARPGPLRWAALALGLLGLSVEPASWFLAHIAEPAEAARLALFSVTVTWVVASSVMLVVGFRRDRRPLRLCALGLFALTALKLLLLDMSGAQQLYRILAFVLVGLVFVGASWAYHRAERRLLRQ